MISFKKILKRQMFIFPLFLFVLLFSFTPKVFANTILQSDLNQNGIADSGEMDVVMQSNATLSAGEYIFNNLTITNNAVLVLEGDLQSFDIFKGVKITAENLQIDSGSSISADQKGYGPNSGPGTSSISSIGASYGGMSLGGLTTSIYGSATRPIDLGSGGYYSGGGAIRLMVSNTFTNDGIVSADGGSSGSGGSIYVTANNITGNGTFRGNGGGLFATGYFKSPGGGGRVALHYQTSSLDLLHNHLLLS